MGGNQDEAGLSGEGAALEVLAELVQERARVTRAEATLEAARRRLSALEDRYRELAPPSGEAEPAIAAVLDPKRRPRVRSRSQSQAARDAGTGTMRARILEAMGARSGEVLTPALLAPIVGAESRDSVRNTLLALAAKGRIEKVGLGSYRAKPAGPGGLPQR